MKKVYLLSAASLLLLGVNSFASVVKTLTYDCNTGNGHYLLEIPQSPNANQILVTVVNASGVEDASGKLDCYGPDESAYRCQGVAAGIGGSRDVNLDFVLQEVLFQGSSAGYANQIYCRVMK
jgi:hypothetical protein